MAMSQPHLKLSDLLVADSSFGYLIFLEIAFFKLIPFSSSLVSTAFSFCFPLLFWNTDSFPSQIFVPSILAGWRFCPPSSS